VRGISEAGFIINMEAVLILRRISEVDFNMEAGLIIEAVWSSWGRVV
jgi:hypothetical protein